MTLDEIFSVKKTVSKFKDEKSYSTYIDQLNSAELQEHLANEYGRIPPMPNSKGDRARLINICMSEFKKRIKATVERVEPQRHSKKTVTKAKDIFKSFGL